MKNENDDRFKVFNTGKNFNETIDNLKRYWWEKEKKPGLEEVIDQTMEIGNIDKETLKVMKELLKVTRIKKMEDYLEDG